MIFIKANDARDLKRQVIGMFSSYVYKDKVLKFKEDWTTNEITIDIPTEYINMDINVRYRA